MTYQHWAGVSPYTSPCGLAEACVFDKQSPGVFSCVPPMRRESYIPKLQLLFCRVPFGGFSRTPYYSYSILPVSVYGTDINITPQRFFLAIPTAKFPRKEFHLPELLRSRICQRAKFRLRRIICNRLAFKPRHPIVQTQYLWYPNINGFTIAYAFRPQLRTD